MQRAQLNWARRPFKGYKRLETNALLSREQVILQLKQMAVQHERYLGGLETISSVRYSRIHLLLKRGVDVAVSLLGIILCLPALFLVALAIKLDSLGPVFYTQVRLGRNGKPFRIIKFRTMVQDAERWTGAIWASKEDPRVTSVGRFLRQTKLDELPQLFNVLSGSMTLVGPRPERPEFTDQFMRSVPAFGKRLLVKLGITGIAQLRNGADESGKSIYRKLRFDMLYIRRTSIMLDIRLLLETFVAFFCRQL